MQDKLYDVIILGAGPAGLTAGLYAGRSRMSCLIIEKAQDGGQISITAEIENYPGSMLEGESGPSLISRMTEQAKRFGAERVSDTITKVELLDKIKVLHGEKGTYKAKSVVLCPGANPRHIGCPGEKELTGKGVSYCATCDGDFFDGLDIYVVGGGDSAVEEAIYLTKFGRSVTIIHRRDALRAAKSIQEKAFNNEKIKFIWNAVVEKIQGDGVVERMVLKDTVTGELRTIEADEDDGTFGIFVFIGFVPNTKLLEGQVELENGYVLCDDNMKTNLPGVFAAGDCRKKSLRQVITAAADGAVAAMQALNYVEYNWEE